VLHCNKLLCAPKTSKHKQAASLPFSFSVAVLTHQRERSVPPLLDDFSQKTVEAIT
jgi:hypothetical protein